MALSKLYDEALVYASDLHRTQVRKGSSTPYIAHLLSVSSRVLSAGGTEVQAIAGLLHDTAEDQGGQATLDEVRKRFGSDVAQIVADCTDSWVEPTPAWRPRKEVYLSLLPKKPTSSLLVPCRQGRQCRSDTERLSQHRRRIVAPLYRWARRDHLVLPRAQ
ncbi:HD domain-containing protein [Nitrobacter winogradskyi]|nr:HD domain-containing protein [Nitrobacter winogradskyi]